jgi:hypothetical protein
MRRTFTERDQRVFADLSGDYNPLHIDPVAARRTMFGSPVVHGIHAVLWGVETWLEQEKEPRVLRSLRANFLTAIGVGDEVRCSVERGDLNEVNVELAVGNVPAVWISLAWAPGSRASGDRFRAFPPARTECRSPAGSIGNARGSVPLCLSLRDASGVLPNVSRLLDHTQLATILATTRVIGMECPGLHSVFSGLDLAFSEEASDARDLSYQVATHTPTFSMITMSVSAPGMKGTLRALIRPTPCAQRTVEELRPLVETNEFGAQRALIIGGSRGLGEVAAKLLSAGGADVTVTYHRGADDAQVLVDRLRAAGGAAACLQWDVLNPGQQAPFRELSPTHLYYFATPHIGVGHEGKFSAESFRAFCDYYVNGFLRTVEAARPPSGFAGVFYPSSIYVEELPPNMPEYVTAKMAGEGACRMLAKTSPGLKMLIPRLPRLATDQTVSFMGAANADPVPILLSCIRQFQSL